MEEPEKTLTPDQIRRLEDGIDASLACLEAASGARGRNIALELDNIFNVKCNLKACLKIIRGE